MKYQIFTEWDLRDVGYYMDDIQNMGLAITCEHPTKHTTRYYIEINSIDELNRLSYIGGNGEDGITIKPDYGNGYSIMICNL